MKKQSRFEDMNLSSDILQALQECNFKAPTLIQQLAIVPAISNRDMLIQSQSGTGKTLVFSICALSKSKANHDLQSIIISPSRELSYQSFGVISKLSKWNKINVLNLTGGGDYQKDKSKLQKKKYQIVCSTIGKILKLIQYKVIKLKEVKLLVIDECDEFLKSNCQKDFVEFIKQIDLSKIQVILTSASINEEIIQFSKEFQKKSLKLRMKDDSLSIDLITYYQSIVEEEYKQATLLDLLENIKYKLAIVFVNNKNKLEKLNSKLKETHLGVTQIHSGLDDNQRNNNIDRFRKGVMKILLCTDVVGRGIDIEDISLVINQDLPRDSDSFLHRVGRTGRYNKRGSAITLVTHKDKESFDSINEQYKMNVKQLPSNLDQIV